MRTNQGIGAAFAAMLFGCGGIVTTGSSRSDQVGIQADAEPTKDTTGAADVAVGLSSGDAGSTDESTADDAGALAGGDTTFEAGPSTVADARLTVGGMAFNECANIGFSASVPVTWQSSGMLASSSGHLTATISTTYGGPPVEADERRDVLFWAIEADYPEPSFGDFQSVLSTPAGVLASSATPMSASFAIDTDFALPPLRDSNGDALGSVQVDLTWVRVYRTSGALTFHVFPGRPEFGPPLAWDQASPLVEAPFGYYAPISESAVVPGGCGEFDYPAWIHANVTW